MKVYGVEITEKQQHAALVVMRRHRIFIAKQVQEALIVAGVPKTSHRNSIAIRAADKLIQRERKAGWIIYHRGLWYPAWDMQYLDRVMERP